MKSTFWRGLKALDKLQAPRVGSLMLGALLSALLFLLGATNAWADVQRVEAVGRYGIKSRAARA